VESASCVGDEAPLDHVRPSALARGTSSGARGSTHRPQSPESLIHAPPSLRTLRMVTPPDDLRRARDRAEERRLEGLVRLVAAGDERALRELYDATSSRAFGVARAILGDAALAEDAVADGFAQVWRDAQRYEPARATVANWLAMIVRARAIDLRRRAQAQASREGHLDAAAQLEAALVGPCAEAHGRERERLVRAALTSLPAEQRFALEAAFLLGMTHAEVARALDTPLGTIKSRIRSGLAVLRLSLASLEAELA